MIAIIAPYKVTDLDSKEARVVEDIIGVYETKETATLVFKDIKAFLSAKELIHSVCILGTYSTECEIKIEKESLISILL